MAQTPPAASSGSVVVRDGSGALLLDRLNAAAEGAADLAEFSMPAKAREAWLAEMKRYADRRTELRVRCHEEIRKANRDTIAAKSAQCLRSDLLLEASHRRKQGDLLSSAPGADATIADAAVNGIDAWIDASAAVVDGVDAGVFTTVDTVKQAKRNLHETYRVPMLRAFTRLRASEALGISRSLASAVAKAIGGEPRHPFIDAFVPCIETAQRTLETAASPAGDAASLRAGLDALRPCIELVEDEKSAEKDTCIK